MSIRVQFMDTSSFYIPKRVGSVKRVEISKFIFLLRDFLEPLVLNSALKEHSFMMNALVSGMDTDGDDLVDFCLLDMDIFDEFIAKIRKNIAPEKFSIIEKSALLYISDFYINEEILDR